MSEKLPKRVSLFTLGCAVVNRLTIATEPNDTKALGVGQNSLKTAILSDYFKK